MRRGRAEDLAAFVVNVGISPSDYWALTLEQHDAIVTAHNRAHRR